jgi:hypothetical protein
MGVAAEGSYKFYSNLRTLASLLHVVPLLFVLQHLEHIRWQTA